MKVKLIKMPSQRNRRLRTFSLWAVILCMLPGILHYLIIRLVPSLTTAILSFTDISGLPGARANWIGLANYREFFVLQNIRDLKATFGRTAIFGSVVTIVQTGTALLFAVILNQKFLKLSSLYRAIIFMPVILGVTVISAIWKLMFSTPCGPIFLFMRDVLSIENPPSILNNFQLAFPAVIMIQVWMHVGYTMLIYLAGLQGIPQEIYQAANVDGTDEWQAFWRITLPMLWPIVIVNTLICIIGALQSFELIMTLTAGRFNSSTLSMQIFATAFGGAGATAGGAQVMGLRQGYAASMSMILFVAVFLVTLISHRLMAKFEKE